MPYAVRDPTGPEQWYWKSDIDMADWDKQGEAWLPEKATLNSLSPSAIIPDSLPGLWLGDDTGLKLATLCSWFDGKHTYEEKSHPDYPGLSKAPDSKGEITNRCIWQRARR